jgi:hypothetical protein
LWLAVLRDPLLEDLRKELSTDQMLSPGSLLVLHKRLIELTPGEVDGYFDSLTERLPADLETMRRALQSRKGDVPLEGFVKHSFSVFFVP